MASRLTNVAISTRKAVRYGIYFVILFFIARASLGLIGNIYRAVFPPPPPPPTVAFDRLPSLPFPEKNDFPAFEYKIETPSGSIPTFENQAKVYFMPKAGVTLTTVEDALRKAKGFGFINPPEEISPTMYRFVHQESSAVMEMNIINGTFSVSYNLATDPRPLEKQPPTPEAGVSTAKAFLSAGSSNAPDLSGPSTHEFLKVDSQGLSSVPSLSEGNLIKVNLFRKDIDKLPAKTPDPKTSNVWFIISGDVRGVRQIVASEYHFFPIDETQLSTYPIKTTAEALEDLKSGKSYIASLGENQDGKVTIRRIYLAYYDAGQYTEFYQPIFVFEGDRSFVAYVPAVTTEYYGN